MTIDHLGTEYDYGSVMHYPGDAFAIDENIPTIITKDLEAQDEIGQRVRMSEADIERVQILYSCVSAVSVHVLKCTFWAPELGLVSLNTEVR